MPITFSGRLVSAASLVIEMDDVFEARIISGRVTRSRSRKISVLISNFSVAASITKSQSANCPRSVTGRMRASAEALSSAVILFFATSRSRFLPIVSSARSRKRCSTSHNTTLYPPRANTCAIPFPIVPAPTIPTRRISITCPLENVRVYHPEQVRAPQRALWSWVVFITHCQPCHPSMKTGAPVHRYFCGDADRLLFVLEAHKVCPDSAAPSERRSRRAWMTTS